MNGEASASTPSVRVLGADAEPAMRSKRVGSPTVVAVAGRAVAVAIVGRAAIVAAVRAPAGLASLGATSFFTVAGTKIGMSLERTRQFFCTNTSSPLAVRPKPGEI